MTHSHQDRIADRPSYLCAAYGCPMLGAMATSTSGTAEWWCFAHFGKDAGQLQRITVELNHLDWLTKAIVDTRMRHLHKADWPAQFQRIEHDLHLQRRDDLRFDGNTAMRSDTERWLERLEAELDARIRELVPAVPFQESIPTQGAPAPGLGRMTFEAPA